MNIKCNSKALMKALTLANNAIPTGAIVMPVLDHFLLEGNDDGKLIVRATDLNHMIKVQTDIDVDAGMSVLLPSMITMNTIKDLPEQEIEIQFDDDNNIRIVSSYGEYSMKTHGTEDFPSDFFNDSGESNFSCRRRLRFWIKFKYVCCCK
jgi:DNA polymerase-3 subunit beta